jgi:DNA-binding GntR family transcriptional regulator
MHLKDLRFVRKLSIFTTEAQSSVRLQGKADAGHGDARRNEGSDSMNVITTDRLARMPAAPSTINEIIYLKLKDDILWGSFNAGERLRLEELRERYKVSFSSLREALSRLAGDGLVEIESHKGARVAAINLADFKDLVSVRQIVESNCLKRAIELGDDRWEAEALTAFHMYESFNRAWRSGETGNDVETLRLRVARHNAFHSALISACDSPRLLNLRSVLSTQAERYLTLAYRTVPADPDMLLRDHEALLRAAIDRKTSLACAYLEEHIGNAAERLFVELAAKEAEEALETAAIKPGRRRAASAKRV